MIKTEGAKEEDSAEKTPVKTDIEKNELVSKPAEVKTQGEVTPDVENIKTEVEVETGELKHDAKEEKDAQEDDEEKDESMESQIDCVSNGDEDESKGWCIYCHIGG